MFDVIRSKCNGYGWFVFTVFMLESTVFACPTCKEGLGNSSSLVAGFGWSIIFMMSMPFLIFAGISGYFYYEICRARATRELVSVTIDAQQSPTVE